MILKIFQSRFVIQKTSKASAFDRKQLKQVASIMELNIANLDLNNIDALAAQAEAELEELRKLEEQEKQAKAKAKKKAKAEEKAPAIEDEAIVVPHVPGELKDLMSNVPEAVLKQKQAEVIAAFETRIAFEQAQPSVSNKMIPNLKSCMASLASETGARLLAALDIDMGFVNREVAKGSRFNVYALQKVCDLVTAMTAGFMKNAVNRAVLKSMFTCRDNEVAFNGDLALAAVSDKIRIEPRFAKHLTRHTVSQNTASTQKSSTMNALEALGIATSNKLRGAAEVFTLTDTPQTRRLQEVLA